MSVQTLEWGSSVHGVKLSLSVDAERFVPQDAIRLTIAMRNDGSREINYVTASVWDDFEFRVRLEGQEVKLTRFGDILTQSKNVARTIGQGLPPGQELIWEIQLDRYYDMTTTGKYEVRASRSLVDPAGGKPLRVTSNTLTIQVVED
jgi:hypothetical protein